ncbi:hypothetical protein FB451DRAFT_1187278 [Mycena latifolia]|nr:hypothetical protein FB451DRAFT_1187278 [Mycena latifolia]
MFNIKLSALLSLTLAAIAIAGPVVGPAPELFAGGQRQRLLGSTGDAAYMPSNFPANMELLQARPTSPATWDERSCLKVDSSNIFLGPGFGKRGDDSSNEGLSVHHQLRETLHNTEYLVTTEMSH